MIVGMGIIGKCSSKVASQLDELYIHSVILHFVYATMSDPILECRELRESGPTPLSPYHTNEAVRLLSRSSATSTTEATTELGLELAGGTALALLASITSAVALTVTATVATTAAASATATLTVVSTQHALRGSVCALLLDVGLGHNLSGKVEPFAEVVETLGGEGVVVILPREASLDEAAGGERLACRSIR
jgi:hypothetical protein